MRCGNLFLNIQVRKISIIPCFLLMLLCLHTPAHASENTDSLPGDPSVVARNEKGILTVGYVMIGSESDWRLACNKSVTEAFSMENGYSLLVKDAQQKHEKQIKAVREFINQEVDYILLDPITESGWDVSLEEAMDAEIPVIVFDREVNIPDPSLYTCWIGSDFYLEGQRMVAWLEQYLSESGYEGDLNLVHIQGTIDSSAQIGRTKALDAALEAHKDWVLLDRQPGEFTTAKGKEVMVDMLKKYKDRIQVVYCENDNEAYGALEAIEEAGFTAGTNIKNGEILVLSFDASRSGLKLTKDQKIAVNTECAPLYGPVLTQLVQQLERGEKPPVRQYVKEEQFSALDKPDEVEVNGKVYPVTLLTEEIMEARSY